MMKIIGMMILAAVFGLLFAVIAAERVFTLRAASIFFLAFGLNCLVVVALLMIVE